MSLPLRSRSDESEVERAAQLLAYIDQQQLTVRRYSLDNGVVLAVWGATFWLDMIVFDFGRLLHSFLSGPLIVTGLNGLILAWRIWYGRRLPIRPVRTFANWIIFWWSLYYMALVGFGVGVWIVCIGPYPPLWFTFLGLLGALPLFLGALKQWSMLRLAHKYA